MGVLSLAQLEQFKNSALGREIKRTFLMRLSIVRDDLEKGNATHEEDLRNKGRAEELRFASDIIDLLIIDVEEDLAQKKEVEADGN